MVGAINPQATAIGQCYGLSEGDCARGINGQVTRHVNLTVKSHVVRGIEGAANRHALNEQAGQRVNAAHLSSNNDIARCLQGKTVDGGATVAIQEMRQTGTQGDIASAIGSGCELDVGPVDQHRVTHQNIISSGNVCRIGGGVA